MTIKGVWLAVSAVLALLPRLAAAESGASDWVKAEAGAVRLIAAGTAAGSASVIDAALQFRLEPGWKIYWRTPGDAGYPPKIDWTGSDNIGAPVLSWPAPKRFVLAGLQNYGYSGAVVLPLGVPVLRPGEPVRLAATVDYLACAKLCVPMQASLALTLPAGPADPSPFVHDIVRAKALVPGDGARHGLTLAAVEAEESRALRLTVTAAQPFDHPDAFIEGLEGAAFEQPQVALSDGGRRAVLTVPVAAGTWTQPLAGAPVTVTVVDGPRALEATAVVAPAAALPPPAPAALLGMLGVALLGGLILNLMPCVLPVLSIKVLGAISHGGAERGHVRAAFLASAAGILASFLALAAAAVAVKAAGEAVGWGIQFQHPNFLSAMAAVVALFAGNLWGLFEIPLPSWLFRARPGAVPHHTLLGHFLSGAFATLLATPCSAPFLGSAVGFALARGPAEIFAVFTALGVGMGAPYLAVAARPGLASRLPRPGPWMVVLKKALGVVLAATAAWLLTVLAAQAGWGAAALAGGALVCALAMLAARDRLPERSRSAASMSAVALALVALAAPRDGGFGGAVSAGGGGIPWVPFEHKVLAETVAGGRTVFVDVTADWCITCKVNKAAVVERGEVARRLSAGGVVAMKADWTRPDDGISRYLASFGRYGIPFNAVYGPGARDGIALPELLTEAEVLAALDKAGARSAR